jgi:hypothetical protein
LLFGSCKKFVEIDPPVTSITEGSIYEEDNTAIAVMTGVYMFISSANYAVEASGLPYIAKYAGLSADEFSLWSGASDKLKAYYTNDLKMLITPADRHGGELWGNGANCYNLLLTCNAAIEGLSTSTKLTPSVKKQLLGEAKFMRSFIYFYLVNLYGDVPLVVGTDFEINRLLPRSHKEDVYKFIINDLKEAQELLSDKFVNINLIPYANSVIAERVRPTKWAAAALISRVYLYFGDYKNAEAAASLVINQNSLFGLNPLTEVFKKNLGEAIWQLPPVILNSSTQIAQMLILTASPTGFSNSKPLYLSTSLISAFEAGDKRRSEWTGTYNSGTTSYLFSYKYKNPGLGEPVTEYLMMLRLGELFLIRAEARAQQGNISEAKSDLNIIRIRAGLPPNIDVSTKEDLINAILREKRVELFSEWGHRWFDLKRSGQVDSIMSIETPIKGGTWETADQLYPIPWDDIQRDPNLVQNIGY